MSMHYAPRLFLRQVPNQLLQAYFTRRNQLLAVPWDRLSESGVDPIHQALLELPDADRRDIGGHFRAVAEMGRRQFAPWLIRVARESNIDLATIFQRKSCATEMAFWTFLNHPAIFEEARALAHWERLPRRSMEERTGLPTVALDVTPEILSHFGASLTEYFETHQGRGEHCKVEHLVRSGQVDFFFAYPADYADVLIGYEDDGNFARRQWKPAFEVIVSYDREAGTLDLYAEGTKDVRDQIAAIFTHTVLGLDEEPRRMTKPPYNLQLLLQPGIEFPTAPEDNLRLVKLRAMRVQKPNSDERILFDAGGGAHTRSVHELITEALNEMNLPREKLAVTQATFQAVFETGRKRPKSVSFTITHPAGCTLRDSEEELKLRRYLREWKIAS